MTLDPKTIKDLQENLPIGILVREFIRNNCDDTEIADQTADEWYDDPGDN